MDNYNTENIWNKEHIVRGTLQYKEYKGHIAMKVGGNCKGKTILDCINFDCIGNDDIQIFKENDCDLSWNDEEELWSITLTDSKGEKLMIDDIEENEIDNYLVKVEIVSCETKKE